MKENNRFFDYNNKPYEFMFRATLSLSEKIGFVKYVKEAVINGGTYIPLLQPYIFDFYLISTFTDIDLDKLGVTENANIAEGNEIVTTTNIVFNELETFISTTKVVEIIKDEVGQALIKELETSVNDAIGYETGKYKDDIATSIINFIKTGTGFIKNMESNFNKFDDSTLETFKKFAGKITNMNENDLIHSIVNTVR